MFCAPTETLVQGTNDVYKIGQAFSEPFHVSNGLRQVGVLSPGLDKGEY